ncbi:hypothetical protein D5086_032193 [Populus alba]|uniref:Uncharacterized protein n=1 Tax=Populus alba TaxID=43335 RepID=A0ACC4ALJ7_POPAL
MRKSSEKDHKAPNGKRVPGLFSNSTNPLHCFRIPTSFWDRMEIHCQKEGPLSRPMYLATILLVLAHMFTQDTQMPFHR